MGTVIVIVRMMGVIVIVRMGMAVILTIVVVMMVIVTMLMRMHVAARPLVQHPSADGHDGQSRDGAQYLGHFLRNHVLKEKQSGHAQQKHANRVREGDHCSEESSMFQRAARPNQVRRDDGLTVARRESVGCAQHEGDSQSCRDHPGRYFLLMEKFRQGVGLSGAGTLEPKEKQDHRRATFAF